EGRDIHHPSIYQDVAVRNELARTAPGVSQTQTKDDVVEAGLEQLQKGFTGDAALTQCVLENPPELSLKQPVLVTQLLFFTERNGVIGLFPSRAFGPVHPRRIILPLERFRWPEKRYSVAATDFGFWSGVSAHVLCLNSSLLWRAAAVVRHWGYVADDGEFETDCLERANGRFTPGSRTFDQHFDFLEAVAHSLPRSILRHHLRCISRAFARAFESNFTRARPSDDVAFHVSDRDDGVIKRRENVGDAVVNIFAALGLD